MQNEVKIMIKYINMTEKHTLNFSDTWFLLIPFSNKWCGHFQWWMYMGSCLLLIIIRIMFTVWRYCGILFTMHIIFIRFEISNWICDRLHLDKRNRKPYGWHLLNCAIDRGSNLQLCLFFEILDNMEIISFEKNEWSWKGPLLQKLYGFWIFTSWRLPSLVS